MDEMYISHVALRRIAGDGPRAELLCPTIPFWNSYYAAQNGYKSAFANGMMVRQQRANEAMINAYRQVHGLPRCSLSLIGQWAGRPAC